MSLLTVSSTNPNLSHILAKNPNTITEQKKPFERKIRKGRVFGWYTNDAATQFRLLFIDSPIDNSFGESEFEYLDTQRYASPQVPISMLTEALASATKAVHESDTPEFTSSVETTINLPRRLVNKFESVLGFKVTCTEVARDHYKISVTGNSVNEVLNLVQVLCFIACLVDKNTFIPLNEIAMEKYIGSLNKIKAPYYLRYLVASRAINNRVSFERLNKTLSTDSIKLQYGDTQIQRHDAIPLGGGDTLIDIGCGEMYHSLRFGKDYESVIVIDADEEVFTNNEGKIKGRGLDRFTPIHAFVSHDWVKDNDPLLSGADVLISECLEHIDQPNAEDTLKALLESSARKIVVTVPNKDFNVHFGFENDDIRHHDHKWEPTFAEWCGIAAKLVPDGWIATTQGIGDSVDGAFVSTMTVFTRK